MSRAALFSIHRWVGLNCGVVLFVIYFSGTMATLGHELDWLIDPRLRVHGGGQPLSMAELADRVTAQHADWSVVSITASQPGFAYQLEVERSDGQRLPSLIHPWTAEVLGPTSAHRVRMLFRVFHKQFYILPSQGLHGTFIVGMRGTQNGKTIFRAVFPRDSYPNFVSAGVSVISAFRTAAVAPQELKGSSHFLNAALPLPPEAGQPSVRLSMRGHNGQEYSASFKTREWHNQPESAEQRDMTYEAPPEIRFVFCAFVMITAIIVAIWFLYTG